MTCEVRTYCGSTGRLIDIQQAKVTSFTVPLRTTPLKGRLSHIPYTVDDFIEEQRYEAYLEEKGGDAMS